MILSLRAKRSNLIKGLVRQDCFAPAGLATTGVRWILILLCLVPLLKGWAEPLSAERYVVMVQMRVNEPTEALLRRSQGLVAEEFAKTFQSQPDLKNHHYEIKTLGDEVVVSLVTNDDLRVPMQGAVSAMIESLNGKVRTRGRSQFFRTALSDPPRGFLDVEVTEDKDQRKIRSIFAEAVPLRELLQELRIQLRGQLSYVVPSDCAARPIDYIYGLPGSSSTPKDVDSLMQDLAVLFKLKLTKQNGTYIISGKCDEEDEMSFRGHLISQRRALPQGLSPFPQVVMPLPPIERPHSAFIEGPVPVNYQNPPIAIPAKTP